MVIGAQLYTVREFTKTPEALAETLAKIADMGYKSVQISCTCPFEPEWMKKQLEKNGLTAPLRHYGEDDMIKHHEKAAAEDRIYGCNTIGLGYCPFDKYGADGFEERFKPCAERIKELGANFAFHNHDNEFGKSEGHGKIIFDELLEKFPPELMKIILDVYWVQCGGADPVYWLKKLEGRTDFIHFKDMKAKQKMAVIGEGNMNFDAIIKTAVDTGVKYAFVEQDECYGDDPFDCLARSLAYLRAKGLDK